jgi:hypothetical protein
LSFRGDAQHRTRDLEIPGLVPTHHLGMKPFENPTIKVMAYYVYIEPKGRSDLYRRNERPCAPDIRAPHQGRPRLLIQIQYHTAGLVRNLRRSDFGDFPGERAEEMEAGVGRPIDRSAEPGVE